MLNVEYYYDQNRKMPYIIFCEMVLPYFILKNKMPMEINLNYDVRETEVFYNDKAGKTVIDENVKYMDNIYNKFKTSFIEIDKNTDYRQNLVAAYFYQELAEELAGEDEETGLTSSKFDLIIQKTKLYCAMSGLSTKYVQQLERGSYDDSKL